MTKSRNINQPKATWTLEKSEILRARYPHELTSNIARDLGMNMRQVHSHAKKLGIKKTALFLDSPDACRLSRENHHGVEHQFKKGQKAWNKGISYQPGGRVAEHQFKKGHKPHTWHPIGYERVTEEGYLQRKMTDTGCTSRDFIAVHVMLWREHHGPVPRGYVVVFKDKDKKNILIENLELITRAELMRRNSYHNNYSKEIAQLIQLRGAIQRKINRRIDDE
jgi:hypothetical protein